MVSKRMSIQDKYLEALRSIGGWATVSEWATKVGEMYPEVLSNAERQAANQAQNTTGLREIGARISSRTSTGKFAKFVEIDASERPRKIRYLTSDALAKHVADDTEADAAPMKRAEIERRDYETLNSVDRYRLEELQDISKKLKSFYGLDFELDHAAALLNAETPGRHHPDNLQFLLKLHNGKKQNSNWPRFTIDEQLNYIRSAVELQKLVIDRLGLDGQTDVLESLLERISSVYEKT